MDKEIVKELIQSDLNTKNLKAELTNILSEKKRQSLFESYYELEKKLGGTGASDNAAKLIVSNTEQGN